ncbi:SpoIIE family protein phosphatase [candidate division KSB1 bacterium]|nr:SpoIIE family protein phosphatase [candidate division KSB1 bacterium]
MRKSIIKEEIQVPAQIEYLGQLRDFITHLLQKHKVGQAIINAFKLSIDEAATNIIKHGYVGTQGMITLRVKIASESVTASLIDQGKYFDPMRVNRPDLQKYVDTRKKGGLGIFIFRQLMDKLDYQKTAEGNELRMTKLRKNEPKSHRRLGVNVPTMPTTLKARYSVTWSGILTIIVLIGYIFFFFQNAAKIKNQTLKTALEIGESLSRTLTSDIEEKSLFNDLTLYPKVNQKKHDFKDLIYAILVVQPNNMVYFSTDENISGSYTCDENAEIVAPNIKLVKLRSEVEAYDIRNRIADIDNSLMGYTHVIVAKNYIDRLVRTQRIQDLTTALLVLLFGYTGIVFVIYMVVSPFQRLAEWVRVQGPGDEGQDRGQIQTTGEIGEIARAFTDITERFKDSQRQLIRQEQLQKEMQVAKEIQQTLLPTEFPKLEGYEVHAFYEAAKEVGGDYFDFVDVDGDSLGIVVADVSGKGIPGSLVMTMIRTSLRTESRSVKVASEVLTKVNNFVVNDMKKGMFVTVFYVIIDAKRRRLNYSSAGHNPMILYRGSTQKTYYLNPHGFPIGISLPEPDLFARSIESDTIQLKEDDILLLYTDGITEAMNSRREMFGEERLLQTIRDYGHLPVQPFVEKIRDEVFSFTEGFPQSDDITLVVLKEESSAEKVELKRAKKAHQLIQSGKSIRTACEHAGITTYAYYNKYKRKFEVEGIENVEAEDESISLEAKHLSIEEKTKIYDIIKQHPDYGAKRISEELNTEKYKFTVMSEARIYEELVRGRLNTRQLREAFIHRSKRGKRIKPPGTPFMTLDGEVIINNAPAFEAPVPKAITESSPEVTAEVSSVPVAGKKDLEDTESLLVGPLETLLDRQSATEYVAPASTESNPPERVFSGRKSMSPQSSESAPTANETADAEVADPAAPTERRADWETAAASEPLPPAHDPISAATTSDVSFEELLESGESLFNEGSFEESDASTSAAPSQTNSASDASDSGTPDSPATTGSEPALLDENIQISAIDEILNQTNLWESPEISTYEEHVAQVPPGAVDFHLTPIPLTEATALPPAAVDTGEVDLHAGERNFTEVLTQIDAEIEALIREGSLAVRTEPADEAEVKPPVAAAAEINAEPRAENDSGNGRFELASSENWEPSEYQTLLSVGLNLYRQGAYPAAIRHLEALIQVYPDSKEAHSILGNAYFRNQMLTPAAQEYQQVKALDPQNVNAYENLGVIYANQGAYEKALSEWQQVLTLAPERKDIQSKIHKVKKLLKDNIFA